MSTDHRPHPHQRQLEIGMVFECPDCKERFLEEEPLKVHKARTGCNWEDDPDE